jgi:hypothetical protein
VALVAFLAASVAASVATSGAGAAASGAGGAAASGAGAACSVGGVAGAASSAFFLHALKVKNTQVRATKSTIKSFFISLYLPLFVVNVKTNF